jgi:hypothetical protein
MSHENRKRKSFQFSLKNPKNFCFLLDRPKCRTRLIRRLMMTLMSRSDGKRREMMKNVKKHESHAIGMPEAKES